MNIPRLLAWSAGFLAFPIAGLAGGAVAGRIDDPVAALTGGLVAGLVIGAGQALASGRRVPAPTWIPATGAGMGIGLALGAGAVGFGTGIGQLALMGAITGVPLGIAQALALPGGTRGRWVWAGAMPALWALGWTVTALAGVDVGAQYTNFGATGALAFSVLSGLLLDRVRPTARTRPAGLTR